MGITVKKAKFWLQLWDGAWTIPLTMVCFIGFGILVQTIFSNTDDPQGAPGVYSPEFLQAMFYASCVQVFINTSVWLGIYFNFRRVKHYHSGVLQDDGTTVVNKSKEDFENLQPWQRVCVLFFLYAFLSAEWVVIWLHLK